MVLGSHMFLSSGLAPVTVVMIGIIVDRLAADSGADVIIGSKGHYNQVISSAVSDRRAKRPANHVRLATSILIRRGDWQQLQGVSGLTA